MFLDEPTTGLDPRSRNQVWDIVRALVGEGTTVLLCTQYLDEADQLAEPDRGHRPRPRHRRGHAGAAEGVRRLRARCTCACSTPSARPEAARGRSRACSAPRRTSSADPAALTVPVDDADARRRGGRRARPRPASGSRASRSAQPSLDEVFLALTGHPAEEAEDGGCRHEHRSATEAAGRATPDARGAARRALPPARARRARARWRRRSTFGWRGMLKIKHVPEQLLDVTITPVLFLLMFTYLFGGAVAGSTGEYLQYILPGVLVQSVLFTCVYSGVVLNTDVTKGVVDRFRSLPIWRPAPLVGAVLGDTRALRDRRDDRRGARVDHGLRRGRRRRSACSPRSPWSSSSRSGCRGCSRRSGC